MLLTYTQRNTNTNKKSDIIYNIIFHLPNQKVVNKTRTVALKLFPKGGKVGWFGFGPLYTNIVLNGIKFEVA